jgi:hypothetical protein
MDFYPLFFAVFVVCVRPDTPISFHPRVVMVKAEIFSRDYCCQVCQRYVILIIHTLYSRDTWTILNQRAGVLVLYRSKMTLLRIHCTSVVLSTLVCNSCWAQPHSVGLMVRSVVVVVVNYTQ